jgi:hypothetical protein
LPQHTRRQIFTGLGILIPGVIALLGAAIFKAILAAPMQSAVKSCDGFAQSVLLPEAVDTTQEHHAGESLCAPDNIWAFVSREWNEVLVLDLGQIVDREGPDLIYYEYFNNTQPNPDFHSVYLDRLSVAVAADNGSGQPGDFMPVFAWGDGDPSNNASLDESCFIDYAVESGQVAAEDEDLYVKPACLHNRSGIQIDIGRDDGAIYRFVRITPTNPDSDSVVQVDAVGLPGAGVSGVTGIAVTVVFWLGLAAFLIGAGIMLVALWNLPVG